MADQPVSPSPLSVEPQPTGAQSEQPREALVQPAPAEPTAVTPASSQPPLTADDVAKVLASVPAPAPTTPLDDPAISEAADQDVIEPEWVEKAEEIVAKNAGNPYAEEEAVEGLQIDYLKKRYGHEVKKTDEN